MKVLFDSQIFDLQKYGGISRFYVDLHNEWSKGNEIESDFSVSYTSNCYLSKLKGISHASHEGGDNSALSKEMISKGNYDILYPTFFYTYFLDYLGDKPFVMSVHDMIPELYPQYFGNNDLQIIGKRKMVKYASGIEVQTETTKRDLINILGVDPSKIYVVSRGIDKDFGKDALQESIVDGRYVLYVGSRDYYKRFDWFIKHASKFFNEHDDIKLVCTKNDFNGQEIELLRQYDMLDRAVVIKTTDAELATLYKYAEFFMYTSEYEGFGLPILESYTMDCIALLNSNDCFKEITFGRGTFFSLKENESDICEVMERVISFSEEERQKVLSTQREILSHYSIAKTAKNVENMMKDVLEKDKMKKEAAKDKKVSIITINLNNKSGLTRTVESVIKQTAFKNIEHIIIDGGSTDGSTDVIEKYKDKFYYYVSEKDNGLYNAMNKGIDKATGDYCLFLNSGDYLWHDDVIEKILPQLSEDIVYGNLMIDEKWVKKYVDELNARYFLIDTLPHPGSFIKTELIKANKYDESYRIISDWIMFRELIVRQKRSYKHINVVVSNFFLGGVSSNSKLHKIDTDRFNNEQAYRDKICVIMPCFNYAHYIPEAINSLKNSTYKDFRCIIVNDGSTDNSEEVILRNIAGDDRFEYYKNENHGVGYTRNFAIHKSDSQYILCLDADDKISPTYIEKAVKYLDEHPDTSIYYGKAKMFYDDGSEFTWNLPEFNYRQMLLCNQIYCSFVYRRNDYELCGGYDETMKGYEDWEFLVRLLYGKKEVYRTEDVVFYYRRHGDSRDAKEKNDAAKYFSYIVGKNVNIYRNSGYVVNL